MQWDVLIAVFGLMFVSSSLSVEVGNYGESEGGEIESVDFEEPIRERRSPLYQGNSRFSQNESKRIKSALLSKLLLEWLRRKSNHGNNPGCGTNPNVPIPQPQPCNNCTCSGGGNTGGGGGNTGGGGGNTGGGGGNTGGGGGNTGGGGGNTGGGGGNTGGGGDNPNYNNLFKNLRSLCFYFNKDGDYDVDAQFYSPPKSHRYPSASYYDPYTGCVLCDPSFANKGQINDAYYSPYWQPYQGTEGSYNLYAQNAVGGGNVPAFNNPGLFSRQDPIDKSVKSGTPIIVSAEPTDYFRTKKSTNQPKSFLNY